MPFSRIEVSSPTTVCSTSVGSSACAKSCATSSLVDSSCERRSCVAPIAGRRCRAMCSIDRSTRGVQRTRCSRVSTPDLARVDVMPENEELVLLERRDDNIAVVTLNNPKVNALSLELLARLASVAEELTTSPARAVVVTGGERIFAAGADISQFGGPEQAAQITATFHRALDAVAAIPRFVIAAVSGYALGGGCELALACDYRIAGERAMFGQPEILLGIIPGGGGTQRLTRTVGTSRAKELCITGRQVKAEEALAIGLADEVVATDQLHERALSLAGEVARGASVAQALVKRAIDAGTSLPLSEGLRLERQLFAEVFDSEDSRIGVESFLASGPGKAEFTGK